MEKIKGRMAVYTEEHKLLEQRIYYTSAGMKRIMEDWFNDKLIPASYITVRPYVDDDYKVVYHLHIPDKRVNGRPPAFYDNKQYNE